MSKPILLETFSVKDNYIELLDFHIERIRKTAKELDFCPPNIYDFIKLINTKRGHFKCSVQYSGKNILDYKEVEYKKRDISKLKIVEINKNIYKYKFADRTCFSFYDSLVSDNEEILFSLNGLLSDTRYTNIVLETYHGDLVTPKTPLLEGTRRSSLIKDNILEERNIRTKDIFKYKKIHLINVLLPLNSIEVIINEENIKII